MSGREGAREGWGWYGVGCTSVVTVWRLGMVYVSGGVIFCEVVPSATVSPLPGGTMLSIMQSAKCAGKPVASSVWGGPRVYSHLSQ